MADARTTLRESEAGFSLLESIVAAAVVSIAIGGMLSAILFVLRPTVDARWNDRLTTIVENTLTDVRAATAYDTSIASGIGVPTAQTFVIADPSAVGSPRPVRVTITYEPSTAAGVPMNVVVSALDADGKYVQLAQRLPLLAPAPGSVLVSQTPLPSMPPAPPPPPSFVPVTPSDTSVPIFNGGNGGG